MTSHERPRVLVLLPHYLPGERAGGPIWSIRNLVSRLGHDVEFRIITSNHDQGDATPYPDVPADEWIPHGPGLVMYVSKGRRTIAGLLKLLRETPHDVLYLNSFFERRFSILPLLLRRVGLLRSPALVIAPRGEFANGALQLKRLRKRLFLGAARWFRLHEQNGLVWQASTDDEASEIKMVLKSSGNPRRIGQEGPGNGDPGRSVLIVARDVGEARTNREPRRRKERGRLRVVFLSRICRMKNLLGAIEMLSRLQGLVELDVFGPIEDEGYWRECQEFVATRPEGVRVTYRGTVRHDEVGSVFAAHDVFLFPTFGENFGHVICEALASGCPVVVSDRTPWRDLAKRRAGWDLSLDSPEAFREVLQRCVDMGDEEMAVLADGARALGSASASDPSVLEQNRRLFALAVEMGRDERAKRG